MGSLAYQNRRLPRLIPLRLGSDLIKGAVTAFGVSIVCAGIVLGAVPWVLVREPPVTLVRNASIVAWPLLSWLSFGWTSGVQYGAFIVGIVFLVGAAWTGKIG